MRVVKVKLEGFAGPTVYRDVDSAMEEIRMCRLLVVGTTIIYEAAAFHAGQSQPLLLRSASTRRSRSARVLPGSSRKRSSRRRT